MRLRDLRPKCLPEGFPRRDPIAAVVELLDYIVFLWVVACWWRRPINSKTPAGTKGET